MSSPHILIIEDDPTLLKGLTDNFVKRGYLVRQAHDGAEGLAAALSERTDLILLDIMLPKVNGYEICSEIRSQQCDSTIIMLTAKGQEDDVVRGLELGADDYVTKPFSIRELLARTDAFLRRRKAGVLAEYAFGDCRLDLVAHKLFRHDKEVELTTKEFQLLEFLVKRMGPISRVTIFSTASGAGASLSPQEAWTGAWPRCAGKIEANPSRPTLIRTIRDVGYRFETD